MARTEYLAELRQDVGYALRMLRRAPVLTAVAVATLAPGILGGAGLGRVMQSELFGVPLLDPVALEAAVLVLTAAAVAASGLPARRAVGLDPATALREG